MKILIICSRRFYSRIPKIKKELEKNNHIISLPNCFDDPGVEISIRKLGADEYSKWKATMMQHSEEVISKNDAVLVLNFKKDELENYIGGATFLEMYNAFRLKKRIYIYNDIPDGILKDEIVGFNPFIIHADAGLIK